MRQLVLEREPVEEVPSNGLAKYPIQTEQQLGQEHPDRAPRLAVEIDWLLLLHHLIGTNVPTITGTGVGTVIAREQEGEHGGQPVSPYPTYAQEDGGSKHLVSSPPSSS